ncbi:hypothetical protein VYP57_11360 [Streptococcus agalactiae]|uniref:hypothetical protein n=1 Tax=Streptococcus agalactiae TaxID=1311 RepID=UPI0039C62143
MRILSIDPSSNKYNTSTTGIVLLNNAKLEKYWVVDYGIKGFQKWFDEVGEFLNPDVVVVEKYEVREGNGKRDNSVIETIACIQINFPDAILQRNAGYQSDIPNDLLKALGLYKFSKSHHQDIRAAARLGLFWAMRSDVKEVIDDIGRTAIEKMAS